MTSNDDRAAHQAVEAAEQAAALITAAGMPRMPARVLMALVAAPAGGYTAAELAERLGVSPAAVSGAVRFLQTPLQMIHRVSRPGDRRDRYALVHDTFYGTMASSTPVYERLADIIGRIATEHSDEGTQARAHEMSAFFRFMARRMPELVQEWEAQRRQDGAA